MSVVCQDGNIYYSNPQSPDSDGDGLLDGQEITYKADKAVHYNYGLKKDETTYYSVSFTIYSNPMEADTDGDGLEDEAELEVGTQAWSSDSDNDNILDGDDIYPLTPYEFESAYFWEIVDYDSENDEWVTGPYFADFDNVREVASIMERFYYNDDIEKNSNLGYINEQNNPPVNGMKYGHEYTMDYNGCELIAIYNALKLTRKQHDLSEIALEFEINGGMSMTTQLLSTHSSFSSVPSTQLGIIVKSGYFGSNPFCIRRYLNAHKFANEQTNSLSELQSWVKPGGVFIVSCWNSKEDISYGLHTFAVICNNQGQLRTYNGYDDSIEYNDLSEILSCYKQRSFITGYYIY